MDEIVVLLHGSTHVASDARKMGTAMLTVRHPYAKLLRAQ
jgi:hypothetical protein